MTLSKALVRQVSSVNGVLESVFVWEVSMGYLDKPNVTARQKLWRRWVWLPITTLPRWVDDMPQHSAARCHWVNGRLSEFSRRCDIFREEFDMAKAKVRESWQTEWVHVDLTPEQKSAYRAWDMEIDDIMELLGGFVSGEHKFTVNHNSSNSTYQASLICNGEKHPNSGKGISGYADNIMDAIRVTMFKATVVLPDVWGDYEPPGGKDIG